MTHSRQLTYTERFLKSLLNLPREIHSDFMKAVELLQKNPHNNLYTEKIRGKDYFRFKLTGKKWRLFYNYNATTILLMDIRDRDGAYDNMDPLDKDSTPAFIDDPAEDILTSSEKTIDCDGVDYKNSAHSYILSEEQLRRWGIPKDSRDRLIKIKNLDELLEEDLQVPWEHISTIIDLLSEPTEESIEEIENKPIFQLNKHDLAKYIGGSIDTKSILYQLSPEQEEILRQEGGPLLVKGGPGSGKSLLALYRIKDLVDRGARNILFTTYTSELLNSSKEQLQALIRRELSDVEVETKTVDELATEFYRDKHGTPSICEKPVQALLFRAAINLLLSSSYVDQIRKITSSSRLTEDYLLEEFSMVIDANHTVKTLEKYLACNRAGRVFPLTRNQRRSIWFIYEKWSELMEASGFTTREKVLDAAFEIANEIAKNTNHPRYQYVIIDEAQDLSPTALSFLARLCNPSGLYLTADIEQSIYRRSLDWKSIQADLQFEDAEKVQLRTKSLKKTFRNTRQIGEACANMLISRELTHFSSERGDKPKVIITDDLIQQAIKIKDFFEQNSKRYQFPITHGVILTPDADYGTLIAQQLSTQGLPSKLVRKNETDSLTNFVKVLDIHLAKGLEFPFVAIVGLQKDMLPMAGDHLPNDDKKEFKKQQEHLFYVGCSRARFALLVCASKSRRSEFMDLLSDAYWRKEEI